MLFPSTAVPRFRRALILVAVLAVGLVAVPAGAGETPPAESSADSRLAAARAEVAAAEDAADAATARYHEVQSRHAELLAEIDRINGEMAAARARADDLRVLVRRRAVIAYTSAGGGGIPFLEQASGDDPLQEARKHELLESANEHDNEALDELDELNGELEAQLGSLDDARADAERAVEEMNAQAQSLEAELATAQAAQEDVEAQLAAEAEARRAAERANRPDVVTPPPDDGGGGGGGGGGTNPGGLVCPIAGPVSYIDSWGFPRPQGPHQGVDLMSPSGTPNVAVVSGTVEMRAGGTSGNGVYLNGDNGDLYYYFHLSGYAGGPRRVSQGEVVGYVGNTGDASGGPTHTHFEVHPGHGGAVNPYPYVAAVC
jgi:murein DD-endopeptidase MepM/ murein hydrolase activator NlpD